MNFFMLIANATFDRWSEAFSGGFAKGAIIGAVIWGAMKIFSGGR